MIACSGGHAEVVCELLNKRADVNIRNNEFSTALTLASEKGHAKVIRELLAEDKIDVNAKSSTNCTALILASAKGFEGVVRELLKDKRVDVNAKDKDGRTSLILASDEGFFQIVRDLLKHHQVDFNANDCSGRTALICASDAGNARVVRELMKQVSLDANFRDDDCCSALILAGAKGHVEVVRVLLKHDNRVDVNVKNDDGRTTLILASQKLGNVKVVRELLKHAEVDVNAKDDNGTTALIEASRKGHLELVREMLKHELVDVNARYSYGRTSLILASDEGHSKVVYHLMQHQMMDVNARDCTGRTSLICASEHGHLQIVLELLNHKSVDVNACDDDGCNALCLASDKGFVQIVCEFLKHERVDVNAKDKEGRSSLLLASFKGHLNVVGELLKHREVDVNTDDNDGNTALMVASKACHLEVIDELLKHREVDLNARNDNGATALSVARDLGHADVVLKLSTRNCNSLNNAIVNLGDVVDDEGDNGARLASRLVPKDTLDVMEFNEGDGSDPLNVRAEARMEGVTHMPSFARLKMDVVPEREDQHLGLIDLEPNMTRTTDARDGVVTLNNIHAAEALATLLHSEDPRASLSPIIQVHRTRQDAPKVASMVARITRSRGLQPPPESLDGVKKRVALGKRSFSQLEVENEVLEVDESSVDDNLATQHLTSLRQDEQDVPVGDVNQAIGDESTREEPEYVRCPVCLRDLKFLPIDTDLYEPVKSRTPVKYMKRHSQRWHSNEPLWNSLPKLDLDMTTQEVRSRNPMASVAGLVAYSLGAAARRSIFPENNEWVNDWKGVLCFISSRIGSAGAIAHNADGYRRGRAIVLNAEGASDKEQRAWLKHEATSYLQALATATIMSISLPSALWKTDHSVLRRRNLIQIFFLDGMNHRAFGLIDSLFCLQVITFQHKTT